MIREEMKIYICADCRKEYQFEGSEAYRGEDVYCKHCQFEGLVPSKVKLTEEDFKIAVARKEITFWLLHRCSSCNYPCGYYFKEDSSIKYDAGCDCNGFYNTHPRNWRDVKDDYDIQKHPPTIRGYDIFFGFYETEAIEEFKKQNIKTKNNEL